MPLPHFLTFPLLQALAQEEQTTGGMRGFIDAAARTPLSQVVYGVVVLTILRIALVPYLKNTLPHKRLTGYAIARFVNEILDAVIYAGVFVFMIIRPFGIQAFLIPSGSMWPTLHVNDFIVANKAIYRYTDPKDNDIVVFRPPVDATYNHPDELDPQGNVKVDFIKRCVGTPGQVLEVRDGTLYRDGKPVDDPHKHYSRPINENDFEDLPPSEVAGLPAAHASFKWVKWNGQLIPLNYNRSEANAAVSGYDGSYNTIPRYVLSDQADQQKAINEKAEPIPPGYYMMMGDNRNNSSDSRVWGLVPRENVIGRSEFIWLPINRIGSTR